MRRLLPLLVAAGLVLALCAPALAGNSPARGRLPGSITTIRVSISFPLQTVSGRHRPVHRLLTKPATVAEVVAATNALPRAKGRRMCPMVMRIGPVLTVVFRSAAGTAVATATVDVAQGSKGDSGSTYCFPIHFASAEKTTALIGNRWVRLLGRLAGTAIS
jgi:hypothetical protein